MAKPRRRFLKLLGAGAVAAAFPPSIQRALAIPAHHRTGTIDDVEHIVILMQENRSFDHYFGTLNGVRGFGDPRAVQLPSGDPVWNQPSSSGAILPFRPDAPNLGLQFLQDLPHGWPDTHGAWNGGKYDQWIPNKGTTTMAYLTRRDIPYHFALADAFTVCDAYYCSFMGATDPNRYHMWTGWVGNDGRGGGPVLDNSEAGYGWRTYPERLQDAGVSWKIYQDVGEGLDAAHYWGWGSNAYMGNYGDNSLLYFRQYQNAAPGSALFERALTGTNISEGGTLFDDFERDARSGKLPQVSWIVAPEAYTEHPNWPANYGAWYISKILDALTDNPEVWSKTAFFLMYDENDGFFDHMVPPTPPQSRAEGLSTIDTADEIFTGNANYEAGPYGLGVRVPMIVMSPWSSGGWVNSQVFDHTSIIRFIEQRFGRHHPGLVETNITKWRRAVAGDLTSAFDFKSPELRQRQLSLPSTASYVPADAERHPDYTPEVLATARMPLQEPGVRPARALPYELDVRADVDISQRRVILHFVNSGKAAAVFHVRSADGQSGPWTYTVGAGAEVADVWTFLDHPSYDLSIYGPNGFMRCFAGSLAAPTRVALAVHADYHTQHECGMTVHVANRGTTTSSVKIWDAYARTSMIQTLRPRQRLELHRPLEASFGWYDLTIEVAEDAALSVQLAGHVETGHDSVSDPAMGAS